ncbi:MULTISPECIES: isovaleryl-CoA dehydrogenase [Achromobacter]|uniref:Isovaleryl-CoA dehydrogenase n=1 Tax=Achromobacter aegrifaciens TaxID=1287736 RepID=A0ABU2D8T8_ACHAE|nr:MULTISPECIES: isovaleryl-CoA dehydrogenase [Achromobacter]MBD9474212.1 isovaleryl-CoA dehydrogenase [Achromobacter sp. ACM01]MDQ1762824.1 isovaleryl-CoA dehydrogenase [Achromobacter aegrifaciens]MDR7944514.1 isovaleryl-CoA dehydrogenase [Achromobacter aegrifaciens]CAB3672493.1 Putative acyl-CoA dehydrogenase AidB [Achromobacter aegrifaciens]
MSSFATHTVSNQVPPLEDYSLYETDPALREAVRREGAQAWEPDLAAHGAWLGRAQTLEAGAQANRCTPRLVSYDRGGHRIDRVEFHPSWNLLMGGIMARGLHSRAWVQPEPGAQVARAAAYVMQGQVEAGSLCPTTMTFAAVPLLQREPAGVVDFGGQWLNALYSREFDGADAPLAAKRSALIGMGLTEKQGGSDLRAVTTRATPVGAPGRGRAYLLVGHKWFFSVPQADAHLVLAQTDEGLSCFFVPRWIPDGPRNAVRVRRLKDKLGNRSNASAEVEFEEAWGVMVGEPGRGLAVLLEMAATTRLDCVLGSAALLRQALVQSAHHARHRHAFGKPLIEQPLMRNVLADLALESEAAMMLGLRLARAVDERADAAARALVRVGTPAAKLWVCKRAIAAVAECMEVWGGNGYVDDGPMPRLYRETPVNSIWEGSGNVMALDVLRALQREAGALPALEREFAQAAGQYQDFDDALARWRTLLADGVQAEFQARRIAAGLARLWQAALLIQHAPAPVAQAFVASRLNAGGGVFGELAAGADVQAILARAWPAAAC